MKNKSLKIKHIAIVVLMAATSLAVSRAALASEISASNVVKLVNEARTENGLVPLKVSQKLTDAATLKVEDMVAHHYFAHTSPSGLNPWHWFAQAGYDYKYAGENLAINFTTAEGEQKAWMNSPTHRKNILNANYQEIGVAVAVGEVNGAKGIIAVQEFGTLAAPAASDAKEFAPVQDKAIPEDMKFVPTVLSTGDQKVNEALRKVGEEIIGQKDSVPLNDQATTLFWLVLLVAVILPIVIVQAVFIARFIGVPWAKGLIKESYHNVMAKGFQKLEVKDRSRYHRIKVRIVPA